MATIKDVAKRAGVAISTVSNALNGVPVVKEETRRHVLDIAQQLNYRPNINARLMKLRTTQNIGLFLPAINSEYYLRLEQAMYPVCAQRGYSLLVCVSTAHDNKRVLSEILSANVDAAAILNENLTGEEYALLEESGIPFAFLDRASPNPKKKISSVLIENEKTVFSILEYLAHLGHRSIGFLRGNHNYDGESRYAAYVEGMRRLDLPVDSRFVLEGYFEEHAAYSALRAAAQCGHTLPQAFVCSNDRMAIGCIRALRDMGLKVPDDVSVVGFDDIELPPNDIPPLTTVRVPIDEIGGNLSKELFRLLDDKQSVGRVIRVKPQFVIRGTARFRFSGEL